MAPQCGPRKEKVLAPYALQRLPHIAVEPKIPPSKPSFERKSRARAARATPEPTPARCTSDALPERWSAQDRKSSSERMCARARGPQWAKRIGPPR